MNLMIYSYHGSKYGQRSGYNYIGPIEPQISLISGTKHRTNHMQKQIMGTWHEPLLTNHSIATSNKNATQDTLYTHKLDIESSEFVPKAH